jgi:hypothetical protein
MAHDERGRPGPDGSSADGPPEDGRSDSGRPDDGIGWTADDIVVPDDLSELDADIRAYRREQRVAARRNFVRRLWHRGGPRSQRSELALPIILGALAIAGIYIFVMLIAVKPRPDLPAPQPLAVGMAATPGEVGGLLPDIMVVDPEGTSTPLRAMRPGVVLLATTPCYCAEIISNAATAAEHNRLRLMIISTDMPTRPPGISRSLVDVRSEPTGQLLQTYNVTTEPVALLVRPDGTVMQILRSLPPVDIFGSDVHDLLATEPVGPTSTA